MAVTAYAGGGPTDQFAAVCDCGWTGPVSDSQVEADLDAIIHAAMGSI